MDENRFPERKEEIIRVWMDLLNIPKYQVLLDQDVLIAESCEKRFREIITERAKGKPLAYILGYTYCYQDRFPVSEQTLIPRYDTEILIEEVKKYYDKDNCFSILDIGTGTGVIALSLSRIFPHAVIKGVDLFDEPFLKSQESLGITEKRISVEKRDFLDRSQWEILGKWDCIVSNPPYLDDDDMDFLENQVKYFEPRTALYAGKDGLDFYRAIADFAREYLNPQGTVFLEVDYKYQKAISLFEGFSHCIVSDLAGLPRVLVLDRPFQ